MTVLVTGATGKLGHAIAAALLERGERVRALIRDRRRAAAVLPAGVEPIEGDVTESDSLPPAVEGCELVFNAMGLPEQWLPDEDLFDRVNTAGSGELARAAKRAGVRRFVHTSTIDVFHAERGQEFDETVVADYPKGTRYERSKQRAEELVLMHGDGMEIVIACPGGVYGPGPSASASFDRDLFAPAIRKRLPALVPGGMGVVFSRGAAAGHLLAAEKGQDGSRYILCDRYVTLRELTETAVRIAGRGRVPPTLPVPLARALAAGGEAVSRVVGRPPLLSRGQLHFFLWRARPDSGRAQRELGWRPTDLEEGIRETLAELGLLEGA